MVMHNYLTTKKISQICSVTPQTVINWISAGKLQCYKTGGGHRRIKRDEFAKFIEEYNIPVSDKYANLYKKITVLIADADKKFSEKFKKAVEDIEPDWDVHCVGDGVETMLQIGCLKPEAIILDISLAKLDWIEVSKKLKTGYLGYVPEIVPVAGKATTKKQVDYFKKNTDGILNKPVEILELLKMLKQSVRKTVNG